jgi:two-component system response regulator YesN
MNMKYGMLIVDDEYLVRQGIRETIDWSTIDVEIVGEAVNGKQGLEAALRLKPDIIFTDIRMPVMDGLEMIEKLLEYDYDGAIIIYSGYQDFEYARKALEFGVVTYLLKPFNNDDLLEKVREALEKLEEKRHHSKIIGQFERNLPLLKERLFQDLLTEPLTDSLLDELKAIDITPPEQGVVIRGEASAGSTKEIEVALKAMVESILKLLKPYHTIQQIFDQSFVIITSCTDQEFLCTKIDELLLQHQRKSDVKLSLQISSVYENLPDIKAAYEETETLSKNALFVAVNTVATSDLKIHPYKQLVKDVMKIISEEYHRKLTVREVAEKIYVSESHLMHEFKENVGKTFNECLTEYRIMKAKEFLLKGNYRVNEVAVMVGYQDVKYFGQVFKEMVGMTPSQFLAENNDKI